MEVGLHARGGLVGDLDGGLEDALRDDVVLGAGGGLGAEEDPVLGVRPLAVLFYLLLERGQPRLDQVDVLEDDPVALPGVGNSIR